MNKIINFAHQNIPQKKCENTSKHTEKKLIFVGEKENEKNLSSDEILLKMRIENYDVNIDLEIIEKLNLYHQLEYYKNVCIKLKSEVSSAYKKNNELWEDNLECGKIIDKLKEINYKNVSEFRKLEKLYEDLKSEYQLLGDKKRVKIKLKQAKQRENQYFELREEKEQLKKRLQKTGVSTVTDKMISQMINLRNRGKNYTEISVALSVSLSTVSKYLKRNKDKLIEYQN